MPVAHAELIVCIHAVHRLLNRIRQRRNAGDALRPEHAARDLGELVGRHHAVRPRILGDDELADNRFEHAEIFLHLLVFHHRDDGDELREIVVLFDRRAQRLGGVHIMTAVDDDRR